MSEKNNSISGRQGHVSALLVVFLLGSLFVISAISQEENATITGDVVLNESVLEALDPVINESGLNESLPPDIGFNETMPPDLSPPPPFEGVVESNETGDESLNESVVEVLPSKLELNETLNDTGLENFTNLTLEVIPGLNESNASLNESVSIESAELPLNESINESAVPPPEPVIEASVREPLRFRLKAGLTGEINDNVTRLSVTVIGVNTQEGHAVLMINGQPTRVVKGQNLTIGGLNVTIEDIPFVQVRSVPESEIRMRVT